MRDARFSPRFAERKERPVQGGGYTGSRRAALRLRRSCRYAVVVEMGEDRVVGFPAVGEAGGHAEVDGVG